MAVESSEAHPRAEPRRLGNPKACIWGDGGRACCKQCFARAELGRRRFFQSAFEYETMVAPMAENSSLKPAASYPDLANRGLKLSFLLVMLVALKLDSSAA